MLFFTIIKTLTNVYLLLNENEREGATVLVFWVYLLKPGIYDHDDYYGSCILIKREIKYSRLINLKSKYYI
jgi:hypothetical protein